MKRQTLDPEGWSAAHREHLLLHALRHVGDHATAEDLVQETFLSAWRARDSFRGGCRERTWLTGILRNKVVDHYRRASRRRALVFTESDLHFDESGAGASWIDRQPDERADRGPSAVAEGLEFIRAVDAAVEALPGKMGRAFYMREVEGCSTEEITRTLRITKSNLWVLIHRARQTLRARLGGAVRSAGGLARDVAA